MTLRRAAIGSTLFVVLAAVWPVAARRQAPAPRNPEEEPFAPRRYVCYRASAPPVVDGRLDEAVWKAAAWTETFVDIEGAVRPRPRFRTRAKMLWDDDGFYAALDMEEPDLWGTLTERDSIIYHDNDVEVFIDPDGDTHNYYELEINPKGTVFDLFLVEPYRDGGPPIIGWDISGLRSGIELRGTLNRPGDRDRGWTAELFFPWRILGEAAPGNRPPRAGEQWRVNFSRVEWPLEVKDGRYSKRLDPASGHPLREDNWVWSPQGAVDMHMPERWGYVQFSGTEAGAGNDPFVENPDERVKWALRRIYYRQKAYRKARGRYASDLKELNAADIRIEGTGFRPEMQATADMYEVDAPASGGKTIRIRQDGRIWIAP